MEILTICYKNIADGFFFIANGFFFSVRYKKFADGFSLSIRGDRHIMTEMLIPIMSVYGLISQFLQK